MPIVEAAGLTKDYEQGFLVKRKKRALDHLTLAVEDGETFGLIGPNGAGKSTALKLFTGLISPTSGSARLLGKTVGDRSAKMKIGFLAENPYFYDHLTGAELLHYFGRLFGIEKEERRRRVDELLDRVGLSSARDVELRKYSKGMTQRLGIAQALINRPRLVFLDEPMSGLDPMGRRGMTRLIQGLREEGVTVVFSSHILPDVEALCDRVAILDRGKLVREGKLAEILDLSVHAVEVTAESVSEELERKLEPLARKIRRKGAQTRLDLPGPDDLNKALAVLREGGGRLVAVQPIRQTLEEYFMTQVDGRGADLA
jgi:ABC-2 type transport system ATP-binding protein